MGRGENGSGNVVENALIKIPLEVLSRGSKAQQKVLTKELEALSSGIAGLRSRPPEQREVSAQELAKLVGHVQGLKRKLEGLDSEEDEVLARTGLRLQRMLDAEKAVAEQGEGGVQDTAWGRARLDRWMAEHLAREGLVESARGVAAAGEVEALVDVDVILSSQGIAAALRVGDCAPALKWCAANRARLKKASKRGNAGAGGTGGAESSLEVNLRLQEFVELVRRDDVPSAIAYARKHLGPTALGSAAGMATVRRYMGLLAFRRQPAPEAYRGLLERQRWEDLAAQFRAEDFALRAVPTKSSLALALQAGLTVLQTARCEERRGCPEGPEGHRTGSPLREREARCPACCPSLGAIASTLPLASRLRSSLVCPISGAVMDEHNPPLALPNGRVYSTQAMLDAAGTNSGQVVCPATREAFDLAELRKVFVS